MSLLKLRDDSILLKSGCYHDLTFVSGGDLCLALGFKTKILQAFYFKKYEHTNFSENKLLFIHMGGKFIQFLSLNISAEKKHCYK